MYIKQILKLSRLIYIQKIMKPSNYYINLYKSVYRTPEEREIEQKNAIDFVNYCVSNPESLIPIFTWYMNIYFDGLYPDSKETMFEHDLEKIAKSGQTKLILIDNKLELVMVGDFTGSFGYLFSKEYGADKSLRKSAIEVFEKIKIRSECLAFFQIDWDYFLKELWYGLLYSVYEKYIKRKNNFEDCFIVDLLKEKLKNYKIKLEFINDDETKLHRSGIGIDFNKN